VWTNWSSYGRYIERVWTFTRNYTNWKCATIEFTFCCHWGHVRVTGLACASTCHNRTVFVSVGEPHGVTLKLRQKAVTTGDNLATRTGIAVVVVVELRSAISQSFARCFCSSGCLVNGLSLSVFNIVRQEWFTSLVASFLVNVSLSSCCIGPRMFWLSPTVNP